jgi:proteasome lid subunit RPN8/RPN11
MKISQALLDEIVAHARAEAPNECCGMVASEDGRAVEVYRATNAEASPLRYVVDPTDIARITGQIEDAGWTLGAIYHSHTRSEPYPSQTDINLAFFPDTDDRAWPGTLYLIVGVASDEPVVRIFDIASRSRVDEIELEVEV